MKSLAMVLAAELAVKKSAPWTLRQKCQSLATATRQRRLEDMGVGTHQLPVTVSKHQW